MELCHCRTYEMKQIDRLTSSASQPRERTSQGRPGGVVVYQYTRKKISKIPNNTQNSSQYTQN